MSAAREWGAQQGTGSSLLGLSQRSPPTNLQAEQALLGAIMANNKAYHAVADFLRPEHFADPVHAAIYFSASVMIGRGGVADAVLLSRHFKDNPILDEAGGNGYIAQLLAAMVGIVNAKEYGRAIVEDWTRRELIAIGEDLVNGSFDRTADLMKLVTLAQSAIDKATLSPGSAAPAISLNAAMDAAMAAADAAEERGGPSGVLTGFPSLDAVYNGMKPGSFHVIAARPSVGKSALAFQIAIYAAMAIRDDATGGGVFFQSLEMAADELGERALSAFSGVEALLLQTGKHKFHRHALRMAREELNNLPFDIDEAPSLNMQQIAARARAAARKFNGLKLVVVDHIHIVAHDQDSGRRQFGPTQAVGEISHGLKKLSKDLGCPVLGLAQLNRGVETREDHRPNLGDLRQSGDIEQDADSVAFIYRPEMYLPKGDLERKINEKDGEYIGRKLALDEARANAYGKAEIIFEKARRGKQGIVHMKWHGETMHFSEPSNPSRR